MIKNKKKKLKRIHDLNKEIKGVENSILKMLGDRERYLYMVSEIDKAISDAKKRLVHLEVKSIQLSTEFEVYQKENAKMFEKIKEMLKKEE